MKYAIVLGTRPEIVKFSPVIRELEKNNLDYFILHSGQHYSIKMDKVFFDDLNLKKPKYNLEVGSSPHGKQTGRMLEAIESVLLDEKPDIILVQGDTNTSLAGALAASKLLINVGHIEAGLRCFDMRVPEEKNRILIDHLSNYLFAPTEESKNNLLNEGIKRGIYIVGNTVVDATLQNVKMATKYNKVKKITGKRKYFLLTLHREENVDDKNTLKNYLNEIKKIPERFNKNIVFPAHPRTMVRVNKFGLNSILDQKGITVIEPVGYLDMLKLIVNSSLVLTDSGGLQEEANILHIPCITLRTSTERPETIEVGSNMLLGNNFEKLSDYIEISITKNRNWNCPYGDGTAGKRIIKILSKS